MYIVLVWNTGSMLLCMSFCPCCLQLERSAFVQTLAKFTLLTKVSGVDEIKPKHVETAKILISIAHTEGNYLQESWADVLNVVSHLELAQVVGNDRQRLKSSASAASSQPPTGSTGRDGVALASTLEFLDSKLCTCN